jgi:hypothetical protein
MTASVTVAAVLLIVGPLLGAVPVGHPRLIPVWSMSRADHIRTVGANRRAWAMLNVGFGFATLLTTAGLLTLAVAADPASAGAAGRWLAVAAYALGGALWLVVLAARARTTPALADLGAPDSEPGPAELLVGNVTSGVFSGFVVLTCAALVVLGGTYLAAGGIAAPIAAIIAFAGIGCGVWLVVAGDVIPAVLYVPTLLLGIALLAGW